MNDTAYDRIVRALQDSGSTVKPGHGGDRCEAQCPAHDDHNASLSVTGLTGRALIWCHAGCDTDDVLGKLGMTRADLYDERSAIYRYDDGRIVNRYYDQRGKKRFRQDGAGETSVLYHRDRLAGIEPGRTVFLVEGEADVHAIEAAGGVATTAPQGAESLHKVDPAPLAGLDVTAVVDRDKAGAAWAEQVAAKLDGVAASYRFVRAAEGKDASDHLAAGHTLGEFVPYEAEAGVSLFIPGGTFVLDVPDTPTAIWGDGDHVIWADREALMIAAPQGVGKTTVALQVLRARLGLQDKVLGYSVQHTAGRVLYLAMDRPAQMSRAARRVFTEDDRRTLDERLVVWQGPPPYDLAVRPGILAKMARKAGADTVIIDSLKDAAIGLSEDAVGAGYNRARQQALAEGIQVFELHHTVKRGANGAEPNTLADVYGSTWLTSGTGSVVSLWGEPGDPVVSWRHLKQPAHEVGPFRVAHDHRTGVSEVAEGLDLVTLVRRASVRGLTVGEYAAALFETGNPSSAQKEKARRRLDGKVGDGLLSRLDGAAGGAPSRYFLRRTDGPESNHGKVHTA